MKYEYGELMKAFDRLDKADRILIQFLIILSGATMLGMSYGLEHLDSLESLLFIGVGTLAALILFGIAVSGCLSLSRLFRVRCRNCRALLCRRAARVFPRISYIGKRA